MPGVTACKDWHGVRECVCLCVSQVILRKLIEEEDAKVAVLPYADSVSGSLSLAV